METAKYMIYSEMFVRKMGDVSHSDTSMNSKLLTLLREIFQYENGELDFGVYRIVNLKKQQISDFVEHKFIENIHQILRKTNVHQSVDSMQRAFDSICEHLVIFFSRYFQCGDFISKRRFSKNGSYSIPYNGEDLNFYWATQDQYYIKTGEHFRIYSFIFDGMKFIFDVQKEEVEIEKLNNKEQENKYFIVRSVQKINDFEIKIWFGYRSPTGQEKEEIFSMKDKKTIDLKDMIMFNFNKLAENPMINQYPQLIKKSGDPLDAGKELILLRHLKKFMTKNSSDFFIHKNLESFLMQELENYIKNEFLSIQSLDKGKVEEILENISVFKVIAVKIIELLGQIENFQKRLWEKHKFIISTDYCISLDLIPEEFFKEIFANKNQLQEWIDFCVSSDLIKEPNEKAEVSKGTQSKLDQFNEKRMSKEKKDKFNSKEENNNHFLEKIKEFVSSNPGLMIDTKYFDSQFKYRLLGKITDLDSKISGIMFNSDNFHALRLLQPTFKEKIKAIYIDPPYNAKSSEILYKNTFKHASWLSLMENRISMSKSLLKPEDGIFVCAIDENENEALAFLLDSIFGQNYKRTVISVVHNPRGIQGKGFSYCHEFAHFVYSSDITFPKKNLDVEKQKPLMKTGSESERTTAKNCFYPIYLKKGQIELGEVPDESYHPKSSQILKEDGSIQLWPICTEGKERKWRYTRESLLEVIDQVTIKRTQQGQYVVYLSKDQESFKTVWVDAKYNAAEYGSTLIKNILPNQSFSFPKSLHTVKDCLYIQLNAGTVLVPSTSNWVLDFFAGSGTTGHAIMELNMEYETTHRFILVEMGEYFEHVLKNRLKKIAYSKQWKEGKPTSVLQKGGKIFKYHTLEQFEDSILNLELKENILDEKLAESNIKYIYASESRDSAIFLNIDKIANPFEYKLKILTHYGEQEQVVDLIETFNYLIGILPNKISMAETKGRIYIWVEGMIGTQSTIIIWRSIDQEFNPIEDKIFVETAIFNSKKFDRIFMNGNFLIENAESIEYFFKKAMQ